MILQDLVSISTVQAGFSAGCLSERFLVAGGIRHHNDAVGETPTWGEGTPDQSIELPTELVLGLRTRLSGSKRCTAVAVWFCTPNGETVMSYTQILRLPAVRARTGLSRSTIYLRISEGTFPRPVSLGSRAVGWVDTEIESWLKSQIEARGPSPAPGPEIPKNSKSS